MRPSRNPPEGHPRPFRPLLNPATPRAHREAENLRRGSRAPGNGLTSTRRDACSFERAERAFEQRARQQSRPRASRRALEYLPTRLSRVAGETPAQVSGEALEKTDCETAAPDEGEPPSQLSQASRVSLVSQSQLSEAVRASQMSQVSEFLKELPVSEDSTTSAIATALSQARQAIREVDRLAGRDPCDIPIASVETNENISAAVSQPSGRDVEGESATARQPRETARSPPKTAGRPSSTDAPVFQIPRGGDLRSPTPLNSKVIAELAAVEARRLEGPPKPLSPLRMPPTPWNYPRTESEEQAEEEAIYQIELQRLRETGGRAAPLWAAMDIFGGFPAARQYNSRRQLSEGQNARCETLPPSEADPGETRQTNDAGPEPCRRSGRVKRPSRRLQQESETASGRPEGSTRGDQSTSTGGTTRLRRKATDTPKASTKGTRKRTRAN